MTIYSFKCGRCGEHPVAKTLFDSHVTPTIIEKIRKMEGITKARLVFTDGCPLCLPQGKTHTRPADVEVARGKKTAHLSP